MRLALLLCAWPAFAGIEKAAPSLPELPAAAVPAAPLSAVAAGPAGPETAAQPLPAATPLPIDAPAAKALRLFEVQAAQAAPEGADVVSGERTFDGAGEPRPAPPVGEGWTLDGFTGDEGAAIAYKRVGSDRKPARVFSGGLALNESFEPLFRSQKKPGNQYFLWTRGHPPSEWVSTRRPLDADARDLARLILRAAASTRTGRVELVLHSFGTLVFQRMIQLRGEPEVARALDRLDGSRVVLLNATTHYPGSEREAGPEFEQMGTATRAFVDWLDRADDLAAQWERMYKLNPLFSMPVRISLDQWYMQRRKLISLASQGAADMMRKDLREPWPQPFDHVRAELAKMLAHDSRDKGWQEALLRRSRDMFVLDFTPKDVAEIRRRGIYVDLVHAKSDQLLNWASAKALFTVLGIPAPSAAPDEGMVLSDDSGLFRAHVVAGDHYFPLKRWRELARILDP